MNRFYLTLALALVATFIWAHNPNSQNTSNWTEVHNDGEVAIAYEVIECNGKDIVIFRLENFTENQIDLKFSAIIQEADGSNLVSGYFLQKSLPAKSITEGKCPAIGNMGPSDGCLHLKGKYTNPVISVVVE